MNIQDFDILSSVNRAPFSNQRALSESSGYSLGAVNRSLRSLQETGYLSADCHLTQKARKLFRKNAPRNAIILAAGIGMRMIPINQFSPKALIEVNGEKLIERIIRQLKDAGISDITVVVGFMKESFDYLIDEFGVKLVVNPDYSIKNNLYSLSLVADTIANTYIIPSDVWCKTNPFSPYELYSWYMVSESPSFESDVRVTRKRELTRVSDCETGNTMIGIAYLLEEDASHLRTKIHEMSGSRLHEHEYWEAALYRGAKMFLPARVTPPENVVEINTFEQLRELDSNSNLLKSDALDAICSVFQCHQEDITGITVLKKGMTNRSFLFTVRNNRYIMRIPGEGTDQLINRKQEAEVYRVIAGRGLCDDPVYINPENGYKITKYLKGIRNADPENETDLHQCIRALRNFHYMHLSVSHRFDLFGQIELYESLKAGIPSVYKDYKKTKQQVYSLRPYIDQMEKPCCLTHIDAVPDNFLFFSLPDGTEDLQLTDWEYAGMQDPHLDIAMWCVYSFYDKSRIDHMIDLYFEGQCTQEIRAKIYCYIAASGLLWSNWCEYKATLGIEFSEYAMRQYRYAKDFYHYALEEMPK